MYPRDYDALIGARIMAIYMGEEQLIFDTDRGLVGYCVEGECCSSSYFHDFYGVKHLLARELVTGFEAIDLAPGDPGYRAETWERGVGTVDAYDEVKVYGYRLTTTSVAFGPVSAVVSFRNSSNGYYGGDMYRISSPAIGPHVKLITKDVTGP